MKKFELTLETKVVSRKTLYRIRALISFADVKSNDLGGWVEREDNLSQEGDAWVSGSAQVSGNARVFGNAQVYGNAQVSDNAQVSGNTRVFGNAQVYGNAWVYGDAWVSGNAWVYGDAWVSGSAQVSGNARVFGNAQVYGNAQVSDNAWVYGSAQVSGNAEITKKTHLLEIGIIGSRDDVTTFFRTKEKQIYVRCGCFYGDVDEFAAAVAKTHGDSKHGKVYRMAIEMAKVQIEDVY